MFSRLKNKYACAVKSYSQDIYLTNENVYALNFKRIIDDNKTS